MTTAQQRVWIGVTATLALVAGGLLSTLTTPTRTGFDSCVPFRPDWVDDGGVKAVRIGSVRFSHAALLQLGSSSWTAACPGGT